MAFLTPASLPALNLPPIAARLTRFDAGCKPLIFDVLRSKWVVLTPEEWVRQHFTSWLIHHLGYPAAMMANEKGIRLNGCLKRCDTVIYSRLGMRPVAIAEYKAPNVSLTQAVCDQITRYNLVLQVPWLMVSNGLHHHCFHIDLKTHNFTPVAQFPSYPALLG